MDLDSIDIGLNDTLLLGQGPGSVSDAFSSYARNQDHRIVHMTHPRMPIVHNDSSFKLSTDHMEESENYLLRANKSIHRSWPVGNDERELCIRRDSFLVRWCDRVYAVGIFTDDASLLKISGDIAWACQIYVDRFLYDQEPMDMCNLYLFDLKSESWFNWRYRWHRSGSVPTPCGVYAAIGYDKPKKSAKQSIDSIWY